MFKRSEEQEWTRFRGALPKEKDKNESASAEAVESPSQGNATATPAAAPSQASAPSPAATTYRPSGSDVHLGVSSRFDRNAGDQQVESLIGPRTSFEGTLKCEGAIRVQGSVQGELQSKSTVFVDEAARVSAKISASQVTVAGHVDGQIFCDGRVEIRPTGHVTGEIHAGALIVQEGAFFEGASKMAGQEPQRPSAELAAAR